MRIRNILLSVAILSGPLFPATGHAQWQQTSPEAVVETEAGEARPVSRRDAGFTSDPAFASAFADSFAYTPSTTARQPRWRSGLLGAGVGSGIGIVAFLVTSDGCWRKSESMCELSIPLYVGAGAAVGGVLGWLLGG